MSTDLTIPAAQDRDVTVIATNAQEMQVAQRILIGRADSRLLALQAEVADLEKNLAIAKKNKLKQGGIVAATYKAKRRITFYEKLRAAFEAGYTLIPDMDLTLFAIRTSKKNPKGFARQEAQNWLPTADLSDQQPDLSPVGEGRYVEPVATQNEHRSDRTNDKGNLVHVHKVWASEFVDEVGFPFALAKPQIVEMTTRAMALKIFDEIGILPKALARDKDPMVVGRIVLREGYSRKNMAFLICWFVDTATL